MSTSGRICCALAGLWLGCEIGSAAPRQLLVNLGASNTGSGLTQITTGDGNTSADTAGGIDCRRNTNPSTDLYMYFDVADTWAFQGSRSNLYMTCHYYDAGAGSLQLQYDSSMGDHSDDYYRNGSSVSLTGSNTWKSWSWHVTDAYLGNRQNNGADFRIGKLGGGSMYVDQVYVREFFNGRSSCVGITPTARPRGADRINMLMEQYAQWPVAQDYIDFFGVFGLTVVSEGDMLNWAAQTQPRGMVFNIEQPVLAIEDPYGQNFFQVAVENISRMVAAGIPVENLVIAMDEPYCHGRHYDRLNLSASQIADRTGNWIKSLRDIYPDIQIVDIEPFPSFNPKFTWQELRDWFLLLNNRLAQLGTPAVYGRSMDIEWQRFPADGNWGQIKSLEDACKAGGIPFQVMYFKPGADTSTNDADYYNGAMTEGSGYQAAGGKPDAYHLESFYSIPQLTVPETQLYSMSRAVRDFSRSYVVPQTTASIDLGSTNTASGLDLREPDGGATLTATIGGRNCRRNSVAGTDSAFYFAVNDVYAYRGSDAAVTVTMDYYDSGSGSLLLEYDAADGNAYKSGGSVGLTGSNNWKQYTFTLTDAYFGNRQRSGGDFRLRKDDANVFYLDVVGATTDRAARNPVPMFSTSTILGLTPLSVSFNASQSYDPDGSLAAYNWDFDDNGTIDATGVSPSCTYNAAGTYRARLTVTDNQGRTRSNLTRVSALPPIEKSILFANPNVCNGITQVDPGDGQTIVTTMGGRTCRRNATADHGTLYIDVDDAFVMAGNRPDLYITIGYYDKWYSRESSSEPWLVGDGLMVQYDATSVGDTDNSFKRAIELPLTNSLTWKQRAIRVTDAWMGNREWGADLRIILPYTNGYMYLDQIRIWTPMPQTLAPRMALSTTSLVHTIGSGSSPDNDTFTIRNAGFGPLNYTITDNAAWLVANPPTGTCTNEADTIFVGYATGSLSVGQHTATITVSCPEADNSPQTIPVTIDVVGGPQIGLNPLSLDRVVDHGRDLASDTFTVTNTGGGTLNYTIGDDAEWLACTPSSSTSSGQPTSVTINYSTAALAIGDYVGHVTVTDPAASPSSRIVTVSLRVRLPLSEQADFDDDHDVDQTDFGFLQSCLSDIFGGLPLGCSQADLDSSGQIDAADISLFSDCIGGAGQPPGC